jgi:hypothetical protein
MDGWLTERGEGGVDGVVWVLRGAVSCFHFAVDEVRMVQMLHRGPLLRCAALNSGFCFVSMRGTWL